MTLGACTVKNDLGGEDEKFAKYICSEIREKKVRVFYFVKKIENYIKNKIR